ncbi:MAG: CRISPR-associated endonuclease Cas2 [Desulfosarcina sp.]|nr:CRISPR-associated endonuclease Cas2 [Desulfobacterales bacterium]
MHMIVAYDIADPKRLNKVARVIKDYGLRVQKSIFEVAVNNALFDEMKSRIEKIIEPLEDGVKYFPLCEKCYGTIEIIGQGILIDPDEEYYIL